MKRLLFGLFAMFISVVALAHTINWHVGDQIISTTTCNSGDNITPPTAPAKPGYHFKEWATPYIKLEYIESTGTQYIDTGELFAPNIKIYMETMYLSPMNQYGWGRNSNSQEVLWENTQFYFGYAYSTTSARELNKKYAYDLDFTAGDMKAYINGELVRQTNYTYAETQYNEMYLFACNNVGSIQPYAGRLYSFIYQNGSTVLHNLIPAKRMSDSVIGMYDTVTDTFFTNAGTGTFVAGPQVAGALQ